MAAGTREPDTVRWLISAVLTLLGSGLAGVVGLAGALVAFILLTIGKGA